MIDPADRWALSPGSNLLVDTNLLVLFTVGAVNRDRIETFKRTRQYSKSDYDLLVRVLHRFGRTYTLPHVLSEVSNLTDLPGPELLRSRLILKVTISSMTEAEVSSLRAADDKSYEALGLVDAAIAVVARTHDCTVLTDDLDLFLRLIRENVKAINFTHLRAAAWGV